MRNLAVPIVQHPDVRSWSRQDACSRRMYGVWNTRIFRRTEPVAGGLLEAHHHWSRAASAHPLHDPDQGARRRCCCQPSGRSAWLSSLSDNGPADRFRLWGIPVRMVMRKGNYASRHAALVRYGGRAAVPDVVTRNAPKCLIVSRGKRAVPVKLRQPRRRGFVDLDLQCLACRARVTIVVMWPPAWDGSNRQRSRHS